MSLNSDLLVSIPGPGEFRGARVWQDGFLVVIVCPSPTTPMPIHGRLGAANARGIKVLALIVFFMLAVCTSTGGISGRTVGLKYWHDPGPFADSIDGVVKMFVVAGTLYAGTEIQSLLLLLLNSYPDLSPRRYAGHNYLVTIHGYIYKPLLPMTLEPYHGLW